MRRFLLIISFLLMFFFTIEGKTEVYASSIESTTTTTTTAELSPKTKLSRLIYKSRFLKKEKYTETSWQAFSTKLNVAEKVFVNSQSTNQDYEKTYSDLKLAKEQLKSKRKDLLSKVVIWEAGGSILVFLPFILYGITQYKAKTKF
ncbi:MULTISPECIES: hypothetical protein [Enterococcus]|uniref:hypothetical protein n=1 Tax=Enterococcus TaxID=1350 RepID=UPI0007C1D7EE|nr:hypothetical protein [Enterococcus hirae]AND73226.1 hypothetical protein A6P53_10365 [Enterococcus hirae]